jgi:hypothetical protein
LRREHVRSYTGEHTGVQARVALETVGAHPVAGPTDDADCLCDRVEAHGVAVTDATASHGRFGLYFHAGDVRRTPRGRPVETVRLAPGRLRRIVSRQSQFVPAGTLADAVGRPVVEAEL